MAAAGLPPARLALMVDPMSSGWSWHYGNIPVERREAGEKAYSRGSDHEQMPPDT